MKHRVHDLYSPYYAFSTVYFAADLLPEEFREKYKAWTIDGAYDHRDSPDSPWKLIEEIHLPAKRLIDVVHVGILEKRFKDLHRDYLFQTLRLNQLIDSLFTLREDLRRDRKFDVADKLRDLLSKTGIKIQDGKNA